jgi:peptidoglycan hydrolase-like protein with peptidoglycan-binding domain
MAFIHVRERPMAELRSPYLNSMLRLRQAAAGGFPLVLGEKSHGVAVVQGALQDLGYSLPRSLKPANVMDGVFGSETDAALKKFQGDRDLTTDGEAGPKTMGALDVLIGAELPRLRQRPPKRRASRPARPQPRPNPRPAPGPVPAPITAEDAFYRVGTGRPALVYDPGAGTYNSSPLTFAAAAQKAAIMAAIGSGATSLYPGKNATKHMLHYMNASGRDLTIDLEDMVKSGATAGEAMVAEWRQAQRFIQTLPPGTHHFVAKQGESAYNYKEETADWYFATGGYTYWGSGTATISEVDGERRYEVEFRYNMYDRYNWDGGKSVTIGGVTVTDEFMGEFHRQGLAREYNCFGALTRRLRWQGDVAVPQDSAIIHGGGR